MCRFHGQLEVPTDVRQLILASFDTGATGGGYFSHQLRGKTCQTDPATDLGVWKRSQQGLRDARRTMRKTAENVTANTTEYVYACILQYIIYMSEY